MTETPHPGLEESGWELVPSQPGFLTSPEPERFGWIVKDTGSTVLCTGILRPITNIIIDSVMLSKLWMSYQVSSIFKLSGCVPGPQFPD